MEVNGYHQQHSSKSENSASVFNRSLLMLLERSVWIVRYNMLLQNLNFVLTLNNYYCLTHLLSHTKKNSNQNTVFTFQYAVHFQPVSAVNMKSVVVCHTWMNVSSIEALFHLFLLCFLNQPLKRQNIMDSFLHPPSRAAAWSALCNRRAGKSIHGRVSECD